MRPTGCLPGQVCGGQGGGARRGAARPVRRAGGLQTHGGASTCGLRLLAQRPGLLSPVPRWPVAPCCPSDTPCFVSAAGVGPSLPANPPLAALPARRRRRLTTRMPGCWAPRRARARAKRVRCCSAQIHLWPACCSLAAPTLDRRPHALRCCTCRGEEGGSPGAAGPLAGHPGRLCHAAAGGAPHLG